MRVRLAARVFGALNALGISMLGEYVTRIYDQVRGRPLYLVDRVVSSETEAPDDGDIPYLRLLEEATSALSESIETPREADIVI